MKNFTMNFNLQKINVYSHSLSTLHTTERMNDRTNEQTNERKLVRTCEHANMRTDEHANKRIYEHTNMRTNEHTNIRTYEHNNERTIKRQKSEKFYDELRPVNMSCLIVHMHFVRTNE